MTQLLSLPKVTADPDNSLPTDGPAGPGRVLIGEVAAAAVTLQNAVDNGSTAHRGSTDSTIALSGTSREDEVLTVAQSGADAGTSIASFSGDHSAAHVEVTGPSSDGTLSLYGNQVLTSDGQLSLGADDVASVVIEDGQLKPPAGTDPAPGVASITDGTTGFCLDTGAIGVCVESGRVWEFTSNGIEPGGPGVEIATATNAVFNTYSQHFRGTGTGTPSTPTVAMSATDATGLYPVSVGVLGFSINGASRMHAGSSYLRPASHRGLSIGTETICWDESWVTASMVRGPTSSQSEEVRRTTASTETAQTAPSEAFRATLYTNSANWIKVTAVISELTNVTKNGIISVAVRAHNAGGTVTIGTPISLFSDLDSELTGADISFQDDGDDVLVIAEGADGKNLKWALTIEWQAVRP